MDDRKFDAIARILGGASIWRGGAGALPGLGLAGAAGHDVGATRKHRKTWSPACSSGQTCTV